MTRMQVVGSGLSGRRHDVPRREHRGGVEQEESVEIVGHHAEVLIAHQRRVAIDVDGSARDSDKLRTRIGSDGVECRITGSASASRDHHPGRCKKTPGDLNAIHDRISINRTRDGQQNPQRRKSYEKAIGSQQIGTSEAFRQRRPRAEPTVGDATRTRVHGIAGTHCRMLGACSVHGDFRLRSGSDQKLYDSDAMIC